MKMQKWTYSKFIILYAGYATLSSCSDPFDYKNRCADIKQLKLINKTKNENVVDTSIIFDAKIIDVFCNTMKKRIEVHSPNVAANHGYFQIEILSQSNKISEVDVIYTLFDGVIIRDEIGRYSKQDEVVNFVIENFKDKKQK